MLKAELILLLAILWCCVLTPLIWLWNNNNTIGDVHHQHHGNHDDNSLTLKDLECSRDDNRNRGPDPSSIRCPLGEKTSKSYHENMLSYWYHHDHAKTKVKNDYDNSNIKSGSGNNVVAINNNKDSFLQCASYSLPYDDADTPKECWPRFIILASHATSGNSLFRSLTENITGVHNGMCHYQEGTSTALFNIGNRSSELSNSNLRGSKAIPPLTIYGFLDQLLPIPFMKSGAIIFKSHINQSSNKQRDEDKLMLKEAIANDKLHGIMRMARNPGDQILRNQFRWSNARCYSKGDDCFYEQAKKLCPRLQVLTNTYVNFHSFWNELGLDLDGSNSGETSRSSIPQMVVHYEHFSGRGNVEGTIRDVLRFLDNVTSPELNYMNFLVKDRIDEMSGIIKEPKYEHGTLVAKVCGKDVARSVHRVTKQYSEPLGKRLLMLLLCLLFIS